MRWLTLSLLLFCTHAQAKTSLWEISNGTHTLYLGGTIHMLSEGDFPLPSEFQQAYQSADTLVLETDLHRLHQPQIQQRLLRKVSYTGGRTLRSELKPETYNKVAAFLRSRGLSITSFEGIKPSMVSISISVMEMKRLGLTATGVDQYFFQQARRDGKSTAQLETPEEQIDFLAAMGEGHEDALLLNTLRDMENLHSAIEEIKAGWRHGEVDRLVEAALIPMKRDYPGLYRSLLVERNDNWMPDIVAMLENGETELVLVGALHLVGDDGLLTLLRSRGYSVKLVNT